MSIFSSVDSGVTRKEIVLFIFASNNYDITIISFVCQVDIKKKYKKKKKKVQYMT